MTDSQEDVSQHPYSRLTPDTVIDAVESCIGFSDARILALNSYENRVYQVGMEEGDPVIVKFYRPNRWSDEQIGEEHEFTRFLFDQEIPVVPPMTINPGAAIDSLAEHDGFKFAIYPRQGGRAPELDDLEHLHQLGRFIGRIHAAGEAFPFKHRVAVKIKYAQENVDFLLAEEFIPSSLVAAYRAITSEILPYLELRNPEDSRFKQISLHGDCHRGNVLWRDDCPHFVDFDDAVTGPAIQDLWMMLSGDIATQQRQLIEIVEGYDMFRTFQPAELTLVEPLRAMRVLHFNAWLARRWDDPAFPQNFPWFNNERYWSDHILELKEVLTALQEPALTMPDYN
ncbi:MAG: Ser/Thr protein kinase RdoA (MazF antagonist) [Planctomycetota bacterium]|jgi:Ser/Thr protein kinase RdoA (MazF antagonist)